MPNKFVSQAIACGLLSLVVPTLGGQVVQAKRRPPVFFLDNKCVDTGPGSLNRKTTDIAIGKVFYTSFFDLAPVNGSASVTCKITQDNYQSMFQTLQLGFGISDSDGSASPVTVNLYVDGQPIASKTVSPNRATALSLDVSSVSNVAIEAVCSRRSQYCSQLYFFNATLQPKVLPPKPKK